MNETIVDFSISSEDISHIEISSILWITQDEFCVKWWRINDRSFWAINHKNIWIKQSWIGRSEDDLELHLESILNILTPIKDKLHFLELRWCEFQLSIILYIKGVNPSSYLDVKYIKFFWEIRSSINFDIYRLS